MLIGAHYADALSRLRRNAISVLTEDELMQRRERSSNGSVENK